tara:strand:+ start:202 stop:486 length:285 start_codon:yes stop_codon:yes gene_type:complete
MLPQLNNKPLKVFGNTTCARADKLNVFHSVSLAIMTGKPMHSNAQLCRLYAHWQDFDNPFVDETSGDVKAFARNTLLLIGFLTDIGSVNAVDVF